MGYQGFTGTRAGLLMAMVDTGKALVLALSTLAGVAELIGTQMAFATEPGPALHATDAEEDPPASKETGIDLYGDPLPKGATSSLGSLQWRTGEEVLEI